MRSCAKKEHITKKVLVLCFTGFLRCSRAKLLIFKLKKVDSKEAGSKGEYIKYVVHSLDSCKLN